MNKREHKKCMLVYGETFSSTAALSFVITICRKGSFNNLTPTRVLIDINSRFHFFSKGRSSCMMKNS